MRIGLIFLSLCALLLSLVSCQKESLNDLTTSKSDTENQKALPYYNSCDPLELAKKYAPEFRLHPDEQYKPSSAEWFLDRAHMRFDRLNASDYQILNVGTISESNIHNRYKNGQFSGAGYRSDFFLQIPNNSNEHNTRKGNIYTTKIYVNFRNALFSNDLEIQYWIFYPYNGPMWGFGEHEGDWEHITVRLNGQCGSIKKIYYAAHGSEGKWYYPYQIQFVGNHPVVYSAINSHASYPYTGKTHRNNLPDDHTASGGPIIQSWSKLEIIRSDISTPIAGWNSSQIKNWVKFTGRWGEIGIISSGPFGPTVKNGLVSDTYDHQRLGIAFYDENNGYDFHNSTTDAPNQNINLKSRRGWKNDDIRSVRIFNAKNGTIIRLYDSPSGSTNDDYTIVQVKQNILSTSGILIPTVEHDFENSYIKVDHYHDNGLNGKVSRIEID